MKQQLIMDAAASLSEDKFDELKKSAIKGDTTLFDSLTRLERIKATQQRDETGLSLLHVAATNGHSEVLYSLLITIVKILLLVSFFKRHS